MVSVPKGKIVALQTQLEEVLPRNQLSAKCLASLTGKVISMSMALGPVAKLMTREFVLYVLIRRHGVKW